MVFFTVVVGTIMTNMFKTIKLSIAKHSQFDKEHNDYSMSSVILLRITLLRFIMKKDVYYLSKIGDNYICGRHHLKSFRKITEICYLNFQYGFFLNQQFRFKNSLTFLRGV